MRGWMTAPYVGVGGGRLWRGAHECPPAVIAGGRECAPSNELPTEIEIGKCAERHSGCLRSASGQRLCGSAAHGLIVRGCATQSVARKRGAEAPGQATAVRRLRPRVGPLLNLRGSNVHRQFDPLCCCVGCSKVFTLREIQTTRADVAYLPAERALRGSVARVKAAAAVS